MHSEIYEEMKMMDLWTIYEGIMILVKPEYVKFEAQYRIYADQNLPLFQRAIESRSLKAHPPGYCFERSGSKLIMGWENHIGYFKTTPVNFLEFVKKKQLFKIPPELEWLEIPTDSGEKKYYWASNAPKDVLKKLSESKQSANTSEPSENDALTGKERQELGRLRAEKEKMDATVLAAIEVGRFIETREGPLLTKPKLQDFVYRIDRNIPNSRIDLIWKSIQDTFKKGSGRPPKEDKQDMNNS